MGHGRGVRARWCVGLRERLGLPAFFTLDSRRHGGMTELKEAELIDGQGRALSAHALQGLRWLCPAHRKARSGRDQNAPRAPGLDRENRGGPRRRGGTRTQTAHVNFRNETDPAFQKFPDNTVSKVA